MLNRIDNTYFSPSLTEQYVAKIEADETADTSQLAPSHLGTRCMKPRAARRQLLNFRNHGGPHHCGRRFSEDLTMPNKRIDLLEKAHAMDLAENLQ